MVDESEYIKIAQENLTYRHLLRECDTVLTEILFQIIAQKIAKMLKKELNNQEEILDCASKILQKIKTIRSYTHEF